MKMNETATQLMDAAQGLVQSRGYNAFSYKDLAASVGIRTASIHYHFPAKADLGVALMQRYLGGLDETLGKIDRAKITSRAKLKRFIKLYSETEACGAICLCGSLASDYETLTPELREAVGEYLTRSEQWVTKVIDQGIADGEFDFAGKPADAATSLLSSLQGALILSRAKSGTTSSLNAVQRVFMETIGAA